MAFPLVTRVALTALSNAVVVCVALLQCFCGTAAADFDKHGSLPSTSCNSKCELNQTAV